MSMLMMKFVKTHPTPPILLDIDYSSKRKDRETQYSAYMLYSVDYTALYGLEHQSTQFLLFVRLYHIMFHQQLFQPAAANTATDLKICSRDEELTTHHCPIWQFKSGQVQSNVIFCVAQF